MKIAIAGPYSADSTEERQANINKLNDVAADLYSLGHIPVVGVNAALPVAQRTQTVDSYKVIMDISLAITESCDALLFVAESPGALKERDLILSQNKPVFYSVEELQNLKS